MSNDKKLLISEAAQKYIQRGLFDKAVLELRKLLALDPTDTRTLLKIADVLQRMGDLNAAVDIYLALAVEYQDKGFHPKALSVLIALLRLAPQDEEAWLQRATCCEALARRSDGYQ